MSTERVSGFLKQVPGWQLGTEGKSINRKFEFKGFFRTMSFINALAWIANQQGHHPDFSAGYNYCDVLFTTHAIYNWENFFLRALYADWSFDGTTVEAAGADEQSGWYVEPSVRIGSNWGLYTRYEDVNGARDQDKFTQWEAGVNFWPVPGVVVKGDYRSREHVLPSEAGRNFGALDLGIGYQF